MKCKFIKWKRCDHQRKPWACFHVKLFPGLATEATPVPVTTRPCHHWFPLHLLRDKIYCEHQVHCTVIQGFFISFTVTSSILEVTTAAYKASLGSNNLLSHNLLLPKKRLEFQSWHIHFSYLASQRVKLWRLRKNRLFYKHIYNYTLKRNTTRNTGHSLKANVISLF